ncbi:MAG: phosphoglucosamine mutase [bacterium]
MQRKIFGTDGIRGVPNKEPLTMENILELGRAVAYVFRDETARHKGKIVIGRDTRSSGYMLESALAAGISSMGLDVFFVGALPTPAIAFLAKDMRADAGVIISASHNPYTDNGIKIFDKDGFKLKDEVEKRIENLMFSDELHNKFAVPEKLGMVKNLSDAKSRYVVFAKKSFPKELTLEGYKIVLDCANGAAYEVGHTIFEELGAEVILTGATPNGININDNCGALHPENIIDLVKEHKADMGISLDGDADRVILVDEKGNIVDGDAIMAMIAIQLKNKNELMKNTVVVTPMSNFGFGVVMKEHDIELVEANVGDRYVVEKMRDSGYNFGGEQSGHIIFLDHTTTGDGIIAALQVLSLIIKSSKPLSELSKVMKRFPQILKNIKVKEKVPFDKIPNFNKRLQEIQSELGTKGRVFVRYSGTEPIARVMIEGEDQKVINRYAEDLISLISHD